MPTNSSCTWWVLYYPANADDWLLAYYGMDRNCLKIESPKCTLLWSLCRLRFKKNIETNYRLDYSGQIRAKKPKKSKKKNYRLDYWSGHGRTNRTVCYGPGIADICNIYNSFEDIYNSFVDISNSIGDISK